MKTQSQRTTEHKKKFPQGEAQRKRLQRSLDEVLRFHIRRNHISGIPVPESIDQASEAFNRVYAGYMSESRQAVQVEEVNL